MDETGSIAVVVLGAGLGTRYTAGDKLAAQLDGKPVAHHILTALKSFAWERKILVCREPSAWTEAYVAENYKLVSSPDNAKGMLGSIHRGLMELLGQEYVLVCLADMPLIRSSHIARLLAEHYAVGAPVIASRSPVYRGPPAIISTVLLQNLPESGEGGARALLKDAQFVDASDATFYDIDTEKDLENLRHQFGSND